MKWNDIRAIPARVKILITRKGVWVDEITGEEFTEKLSWDVAWAIAGVHSYQWWWVHRWGRLDCGCGRNPLTRRFVWYDLSCDSHGLFREGL